MRPQSAKAKGRRLQQMVRDYLSVQFGWERGDCESRSMGASGTDLMLSPRARKDFPFAIECKNVEKLNVHEAFKQAKQHAEGTPQTPLLIFAKNNTEPLVTLRFTDFVEILRRDDDKLS